MTANQPEESGGQHSPTIPVQSIYSLLARTSRSCWLLNWSRMLQWCHGWTDSAIHGLCQRGCWKTTRGWRAWSLLWTMTSESEEHYRLLRHRVLPIWGQGLLIQPHDWQPTCVGRGGIAPTFRSSWEGLPKPAHHWHFCKAVRIWWHGSATKLSPSTWVMSWR